MHCMRVMKPNLVENCRKITATEGWHNTLCQLQSHLLLYNTHTHTHPFNGPFSRTTWVSRYQKGKTNLDFTEARDSEWQWRQHLTPDRQPRQHPTTRLIYCCTTVWKTKRPVHLGDYTACTDNQTWLSDEIFNINCHICKHFWLSESTLKIETTN